MVAVEGYLTLHCLWVMLQLGLRRLVLTWRQTFCLFGFLLSIIVAFVAEALTATRDFASPPPLHLTAALVQTIPMILWVVVGVIFTVSAVLIVEQEMSRIAHSRGYTNPIPLTRSESYYTSLCHPLSAMLLS